MQRTGRLHRTRRRDDHQVLEQLQLPVVVVALRGQLVDDGSHSAPSTPIESQSISVHTVH